MKWLQYFVSGKCLMKAFMLYYLCLLGHQNNTKWQKIFINLRINLVVNSCLCLFLHNHKKKSHVPISLSEKTQLVKSIRRAVWEWIIVKSRLSFLPQGLCRKWGCIMQTSHSVGSAQISVAPDSTCSSQKDSCVLYFSYWFIWDLSIERFQVLGFSTNNPAHFMNTFFFPFLNKKKRTITVRYGQDFLKIIVPHFSVCWFIVFLMRE